MDELLPEPLVAVTERTITDRSALHAELEAVRGRGWSFEQEQGTEGVACVATAVDYRIPATDAISCSMPIDLAKGDEPDRVVKAITTHTRRLAAALRRAGIRVAFRCRQRDNSAPVTARAEGRIPAASPKPTEETND